MRHTYDIRLQYAGRKLLFNWYFINHYDQPRQKPNLDNIIETLVKQKRTDLTSQRVKCCITFKYNLIGESRALLTSQSLQIGKVSTSHHLIQTALTYYTQ